MTLPVRGSTNLKLTACLSALAYASFLNAEPRPAFMIFCQLKHIYSGRLT